MAGNCPLSILYSKSKEQAKTRSTYSSMAKKELKIDIMIDACL